MSNNFIIKGDFYYCSEERHIISNLKSYCVVENGISQGLFEDIPKEYAQYEVIDYSGYIIMPGLIDMHLHAPQYAYRGLGLDLELLDWLNKYTFPEEKKYIEHEYAKKAYQIFCDGLRNSYTTRAVIYGTIHVDATLLLMEALEETGMRTYVGKVNMDRNAPDGYIENTVTSIQGTNRFIDQALKRFQRTRPIITPRFIPSCSDELLEGLSQIQMQTSMPVQSHLSENRREIEWVKALHPEAAFYGEVYEKFGMFGKGCNTIMAHCVSSTDEELLRIRDNHVYIAHCPNSNINLSSGIAPVRKFLSMGIRVGIGTDIGAGHSLSMFDEIVAAVQVSKLRWRYIDGAEPIKYADALYMATRGGGEFFGKVGSFEKGFEFDAIVLDDSRVITSLDIDSAERFIRIPYISSECSLLDKFVKGKRILLD